MLALVLTTIVAAAAQGPADPGWPRVIEQNGDRLVYYQPQLDSWKNATDLTARVAVEVTPRGEQKPIVGMVEAHGTTAVDLDKRSVQVAPIDVRLMRFQEKDANRKAAAERVTQALFPKGPVTIALDRLLADAAQAEQKEKAVKLKNDAPKILVSEKPARLVIFDGEPVFNQIEKTGLSFAVNTNWPMFRDDTSKKHYLLDEKTWLEASDVKGPWTAAKSLPQGLSSLPNDDQWKDVRAALPLQAKNQQPRKIFVSFEPAEIIVTNGKPKLAPIRGTQLQYVSNTDSQLFWHTEKKNYYFLVAGRWFRAPELKGPWTFTTPELPPDFAKIPPDSKQAAVLASVPGTTQAREAVLEADIPQKATVNRTQTKVQVTYAGDPIFKPVEGSSLQYAVNSSFDVIKAGSTYYVCHQGVWFSGPSPTGPFAVTDKVPEDIYKIPPSSPVYPVTYVHVYDSDPDDVVFGFTAGYIGGFVTAGIVAWGTGFWYRPWVAPFYAHPVYYPRPYTYGAGARYNPYSGAYYRGGAAYGPYGGMGASARYNPSTGRYSRGVAAYGPNQSGAAARAYNPRTGVASASYQRSTPYGNWGRSAAVGPRGNAAQTGHATGARGTVAGGRTAAGGAGVAASGAGGQGAVVRTANNNVYAGRDGNVYRSSGQGNWQQYGGNGNWQGVQNSPRTGELNSAASARADGAQRTQASQSQRASQARSSASSASRPSTSGASRGGGRMGGGGGRRR
jgi:hypothetical protein